MMRWTRRSVAGAIGGAVVAAALGWALPASAQQKTDITFARFFGACEGDYGNSQDV
ncbi:MAG: hypothetical protein JOY70_07835, partial [Acidisphaera sp.]|nr:hypothetical protein [Acidisphaera sp.]